MAKEELQKVVPSPIYSLEELSPTTSHTLTPATSETQPSKTQSLSLSLSQQTSHDSHNSLFLPSHGSHGSHRSHISISKWVIPSLYRIQKYSAYSLVSFVGIHLTSVVIIPILPIPRDVKDQVFSLAKAVYQDIPGYELLLIYGAGVCHILLGIILRVVKVIRRNRIEEKRRKAGSHVSKVHMINSANLGNGTIDIRDNDEDIGLGGISNLFGLGYRRSITLTMFGLSPLQFTGWFSIPLVLFHLYKFRYVPWLVEGDSSLVNLEYIPYVVNLKHPVFNQIALCLLVWSVSYHMMSGIMKYRGWFSKYWKRVGLTVINVLGWSGCLAVWLYKRQEIDVNNLDFVGKAFHKYVNAFLL
ncbi:conserved hypothetical protein [Lodderomyces elongisporus NRRL YB-4239]|uniref:Mitochondrial adapter protein MCP1 transmembrane domain-containing protein n=1 Tax=Lodderomyces elongisporus (strain ATCC 11503 / CBS 2605 / JCM 1781 / NBRC 1676 / NRRL YB-4239) TaxID=379508 RepID=A5E636_LODEL|nr:conserved hypothetical protein [Lodderomyces elongisporus NRRL YB-4239]